jgi:hypothetical protein
VQPTAETTDGKDAASDSEDDVAPDDKDEDDNDDDDDDSPSYNSPSSTFVYSPILHHY